MATKPSVKATQRGGMWTARIGLRYGVVAGFGEDKATAVDRAKRLADAVRYVTAVEPRLRF